METPLDYYKKHLTKYQAEVKTLKKRLTKLSFLRVLVFVATSLAIYLFFERWQIALVFGLVGAGVFLFLLSKYTDAKHLRDFNKALVNINEDEIEIALSNFHDRADGKAFENPSHQYSLDIDLFGRGSFFQYANRTTINEGTQQFATTLLANETNGIERRQEAIKELASKPEWRQCYTASASLIKAETPAKNIIGWLNNYQSFLPKFIKWLPIGFSVISILISLLTIFNVIENQMIVVYWLLFGLAISGVYVKRISQLSSHSDRLKDTFRQYAILLDYIEKERFASGLLMEKQKQIQSEHEKASHIFKRLSRSLGALDNRNNLLGALFGNGLFLMDIRNSYSIEMWIDTYADKVSDWFEVVSFFDAYNSLGNFAFNHQEYVFPHIKNNDCIIKASNLSHPLLDREKRVPSDLSINEEQFFIVTGANMAGKSTFLRTVSLHIVMANIGLPVCATSSEYSPVKLITSMRTSDSLTDDSSYFFSELSRLKYIVDAIQKEPYFIVLDEILKGTNSTDKAIGSKKFVEKLVASKATGIIATHDLSLCEIEKELDDVKNYYFDAQIIKNELYFDYKLKQGICQNMNASFLLKKMEIV
ncbi:DNA mismatch repair protein MutS [Hyunsoonleella sp. SJ7]|uniref:DNA mismatch repair protein MutS n=1 Tax=Hyunsoonleella aquatilis TaxID=2762758 RepID=A0A923HCL2_9FLAO|nr:DNA mismatch repair protein MutS [Hyunsoonleella aquatilis]MBC3756945.1 DNA mismatch repair protein MutS [Hyunsoonleella aquatilis]